MGRLPEVELKRALNLPWLVFYGIGVTVGAGIFALVGEIVAIAGNQAAMAFLAAGAVAAVTGVSYARLASAFPRAGGEVVFVNLGFGPFLGTVVGCCVLVTAIISSAVVAKAFAGYLGVLLPLPRGVLTAGVIVCLAMIAWYGVRESVAFAGVITVLEVGTLVVIALVGAPLLADGQAVAETFTLPEDGVPAASMVAATVIAFFAFLGFEDIVNMAEETIEPARNLPRAIFWSIGITVVLYVTITLIATALPDRAAVISSKAPLVTLFEMTSGRSGRPIAAIAAVAMVNGILVQIVMASRVFYGMAREGLAPAWFGAIDPWRRTPRNAIIVIALSIIGLALGFPLVHLAAATSLVILSVFTLVNLALWRIGGRRDGEAVRRWRWWGMSGAVLTIAVLIAELLRMSGAF